MREDKTMKKHIFIALMGILATMSVVRAQAQEQRVVTNVSQVTIELKNNTTVTISENIDSVVYIGTNLGFKVYVNGEDTQDFLFSQVLNVEITTGGGPGPDPGDNNKNANWNISGLNIPESKGDPTFTNMSTNDYAWRLEYPHINTASGNQRVVKSCNPYGITYSVEWDNNLIANRWTCYTMCSKNNASNVTRTNKFYVDDAVTTSPDNSYAESNTYSRGHLCPSADRLASTEQNKQTFYMTNMQPQYQNHNGGIWATLEGDVRSKWQPTNNIDTLYVVKAATIADVTLNNVTSTGIITTTTDDEGQTLVVPKYFYMAFLYFDKMAEDNKKYKAFAIWTQHLNSNNPNESTVLNPNAGYIISIDELEKRTGIDFFCNLPDDIEDKVEATATYWDNSQNNNAPRH